MKPAAVVQSMRIPFLVLTPATVFLGASLATASPAAADWRLLIPAMIAALLAHVSVNTLNEYIDFKSGLDLKTTRTSFSGGSGALPADPGAANAVLITGVASLLFTLVIGGFFAWLHGWGIVLIGLLGIALVVFYTPWINKHPVLCLIAPGTGFGLIMVVGTQYAIEGAYSSVSWLAALVPFLLVNNLLLLNQYPDVEADSSVGRRHFPIACGLQRSTLVYGVSVLLAMFIVVACVMAGSFPVLSLAALAPVSLGLLAWQGAARHGRRIGEHPHYLAANVAAAVLTPVVLGAAFVYGG